MHKLQNVNNVNCYFDDISDYSTIIVGAYLLNQEKLRKILKRMKLQALFNQKLSSRSVRQIEKKKFEKRS